MKPRTITCGQVRTPFDCRAGDQKVVSEFLQGPVVPATTGTIQVVACSSDLTDGTWNLLEPPLLVFSKRGPKHGDDLRHVVDAMLHISHTGCQWHFRPEQFGPWTKVRSQSRRWSRNGTWTRVLTALHTSMRTALGREEPQPSMVAADTHLARGTSN